MPRPCDYSWEAFLMEKTFKVYRFDPERDERPYFQEYRVPERNGMTVLDGLFYIQKKIDPSLAFRFSCRGSVCGSCAMNINGRNRLSCETQVSLVKGVVKIRPLGHFRVLRDLVVDLDRFWEKYGMVMPYLVPSAPPPEKEMIQTPDERERLGDTIDCILCANCHASCTVAGTDGGYLGPAAILKTDRFLRDSRDGAGDERLRIVDDIHGVWRCHTILGCQEVCPKGISPTSSIMGMRKRMLKK
jgi:succinate dehydrogenase / fumarate reductase iron-sulfur subunit